MTIPDLLEDVASALEVVGDEIDDLSIHAYWVDVPSPPTIDVYPSTPFQEGAAFGAGNNLVYLTVRARVALSDPLSGQQLLMRLLDPSDAASVEVALAEVDGLAIAEGGVSGFTQYADDAPAIERLLGCEWRVRTFL